ncbi:restriction endonuclease, partial [Acidocella sp.]|uniref:restriction endonuclease n=1 Tax=Acidocella sp. TaxID=50710 RepID=UPI0026278E4F
HHTDDLQRMMIKTSPSRFIQNHTKNSQLKLQKCRLIYRLVSKVLFQCKRYTKSVSPSHVRDFRGAMAGRADKGIIITTGSFTTEARREASRDGVPPIELIDGEKLVEMLERLELGLTPVTTFQVDDAFFNEFRS